MRWLRLSVGCAALLLAALILAFPWIVTRIAGASTRLPEEVFESLSPEALELLEGCLRGLRDAPVVDVHAHVVGLGLERAGCFVSPRMLSPLHPAEYARYRVYLSAARVSDPQKAESQYTERLVDLAGHLGLEARLFLLAFDKHYLADGEIDLDKTHLYTPNEHVWRLSTRQPELFEPAISVHPDRPGALAELEWWAARGVRLVKWLPNAMGIDPLSGRHDAFYRRMAELGLVLLSHAGEEKAVELDEDQELGNPLRLRRPLRAGVKVIVAHCAGQGRVRDLDRPERPPAEAFDLFLRLMDEPEWEGLLFGEISGLTQVNRLGRPLEVLLESVDLHPRLVHGSDYPLPAIDLLIQTGALVRRGFLTRAEADALDEIFLFNPLLFDLALKRCLRHPESGARFPASVFHDHPELNLLEGR